MSQFIAIHGPVGGTGKSTIAVNLANYLASKGKRVLIIETDVGGPALKAAIGARSSLHWNDFYKGRSIKDIIYKNTSVAFDSIFADKKEITSDKKILIQNLQRLQGQKRWLSNEYDYVIFDTRPGHFPEVINTLTVADTIIQVNRIDADNVDLSISMHDWLREDFAPNKRIIHIINQEPDPLPENYEIEIDPDAEKAMKNWETFIEDKEHVVIPLDPKVATYLRWKRILPLDHIFIDYIGEISKIVG
ncbi:MAG: MinD/ParA family protein [Candidatus Odinarchaeota archaeon]